MFDATDLELARRAHANEMGAESRSDRAWSRFYDSAEAAIRKLGFVRKGGDPDNQYDNGLDGCGSSDGYSIDQAYEAFERGQTVEQFIESVIVARHQLGL